MVVPQDMTFTYVNPIRDKEIIAQFRRASELTDCVFAMVISKIRDGMSEQNVQELLDESIHKTASKSGEKISLSFSIVESGERTSLLHGRATERIINKGEFVTIDFGLNYKDITTDFTRTFVVGKVDKQKYDVYETVKKAFDRALDGIYCGMTGVQADALSRDVIVKAGYDFKHGLGHGLNGSESNRYHIVTDGIVLDIKDTKTVLEENMVFTIEPGIYLENNFGVRIEDTVLLTKSGVERLTRFPYELIEI